MKYSERCSQPSSCTWIVACVLLLTLFGGCGGHESAVTGNVTLDGKPLTTGTVTFIPAKGGPAAYGGVQSDGTYKLSTGATTGLPAGEYVVTVVATTAPQAGFPYGKLITPQRYGKMDTTDLKYTITSGNNQIDIALKSP